MLLSRVFFQFSKSQTATAKFHMKAEELFEFLIPEKAHSGSVLGIVFFCIFSAQNWWNLYWYFKEHSQLILRKEQETGKFFIKIR